MSTAIGEGLVFLGESIKFERRIGFYVERRWRGTEEACQGLIGDLVQTGGADDFDIQRDGNSASWTAIARFNANRDETWEVPSVEVRVSINKVMKDILEPPRIFDATDADVRAIRAIVNGGTLEPSEEVGLYGFDGADSQSILNLMMAGVTSRPVYQQVITKTSTASLGYIWAYAYTNAGKIISGANIEADVGLTIPIPLQSGVSSDANFEYGWLKNPPELTITSGPKFQLIETWEFGYWSTLIHDFA